MTCEDYSKKKMTFKEYVEKIDALLKEHPEWAGLPVFAAEHWAEEGVAFPEHDDQGFIWV
jgi:hypothetical protein